VIFGVYAVREIWLDLRQDVIRAATSWLTPIAAVERLMLGPPTSMHDCHVMRRTSCSYNRARDHSDGESEP
jgi:hypothetical protein